MGKILVHDALGRRTSGRIVEAEAYIGESDPACHAAPGPTRRNAPLYGPPGHAYVYLNYGMHYLVNAVTEPAGQPAAVLIRALDPVEGVDLMRRRRLRQLAALRARRIARGGPPQRGARTTPRLSEADLCRGPGNLTVALAITLGHNRGDLVSGPVRIEDDGYVPAGLEWSPRIGLTVGTAAPWRCVVAGSACLSGARR